MAAQDIEYVELYTSDMRSTVDYFVGSFGFTRHDSSTPASFNAGPWDTEPW